MVSNAPYTNPFGNYHLFEESIQKHQQTILSLPHNSQNSIMDFISKDPRLSIFKTIINLAKLDGMLNDDLANFTILVPSNEHIQNKYPNLLRNLDIGTARNIIKSSTLNRRIPFELLSDDPYAYFFTLYKNERLLFSNINDVVLINQQIKIVEPDIIATNGIIHIIDDIIFPESFC
jgi:uncharacterized surface protein with fasciclin (FAS1) repeats